MSGENPQRRALEGKRIAFLAAPEGAEELELSAPWRAVEDAGGAPRLISTRPGAIRLFRHLDRAGHRSVDETLANAGPTGYDGLVLPGGIANADHLRRDEQAVAFVRTLLEAGAPVAAIGHALWTLIEAGAVPGRRLTSSRSLATDLRNAGAIWVDAPVVADGGLISSRGPEDLPAFCAAIVGELARGARKPPARKLDLRAETEAYQALLEGHRADPDDEELYSDMVKARAAMEVAWIAEM
jgi:protease I